MPAGSFLFTRSTSISSFPGSTKARARGPFCPSSFPSACMVSLCSILSCSFTTDVLPMRAPAAGGAAHHNSNLAIASPVPAPKQKPAETLRFMLVWRRDSAALGGEVHTAAGADPAVLDLQLQASVGHSVNIEVAVFVRAHRDAHSHHAHAGVGQGTVASAAVGFAVQADMLGIRIVGKIPPRLTLIARCRVNHDGNVHPQKQPPIAAREQGSREEYSHQQSLSHGKPPFQISLRCIIYHSLQFAPMRPEPRKAQAAPRGEAGPMVLVSLTMVTGRVRCTVPCSSAINPRSTRATSRPRLYTGCCTVVRGGERYLPTSMPSKPITETCSGTFTPASFRAWMAPMAIRSLQAMIAVTSPALIWSRWLTTAR